MNVKMPRGQEALEILEQHMEPSKVALLLSIWQTGSDDYIKIKDQLFADETVKTLYEKIQTYQNSKE
ncbi:hypothetical protein LC608_19080 [Nostoc sp. XA010]|uniref:hypothetical protein n=1 Tax=Nostoc sp. XA010 TaxID=2780407 RepID=UPI001E4FC5AE|nr:hypothetical protein [Nostoc sp. XA010]MCC5659040.1 hypothetical protein [Nostoc sp. XA010]